MKNKIAMILTNDDGTIVLGKNTLVYIVPVEEKDTWLAKYNPTFGEGYEWVAYNAVEM